MKSKKRLFAAVLAGLFMLSGCSIAEIDELYSLPQPASEYLQLQKLIDDEIAQGCEYAAPTAGAMRQSIQLIDLDGDGADEALAFLRSKTLEPVICIYRKNGSDYVPAAKITGDGSAIGRVECADLDGDGVLEILAAWESDADIRLMKVYTVKNWAPAVLLTASCLDYGVSDLDGDGKTDVVTLSFDAGNGQVEMFTLGARGSVTRKVAPLSSSLKTADRFRIAEIAAAVPAVFVEGSYGEDTGELMTDIFVCKNGSLENITLNGETSESFAKRQYVVYCTDIDGNGSLDVPFAEKLGQNAPGGAESFIFDWYTYDASGGAALCASTYHCYTDGWYLTLPEGWKNGLTVHRTGSVSGEHGVVFSVTGADGRPVDQLTIYALSDENRDDRAKLNGRFVLESSKTVVYAAEIAAQSELPDTQAGRQEIIASFHTITSEWITGAL